MTSSVAPAPSIVLADIRRRGHRVLGLAALGLGVSVFLALVLGPEIVPLDDPIVRTLRLPRVVLGIGVGAALGVAGAALQGLFRNPLADPGLIGVASGARLGATAFIVLGGGGLVAGSAWAPVVALPIAAFVGALGTLALVWLIAGNRPGMATLLLTGIALTFLEEALIGLLSAFADEQALKVATLWRLGSLGGIKLEIALPVLAVALIGTGVLMTLARKLDALLLGDDAATTLGVDVKRLRRILVVTAALVVGTANAFAGIVAFIGLAVPHLVRLMAGPAHRVVLPGSAIAGAALVVLSDLLARTVTGAQELPLGVVTAILGAPFLIYLVVREAGR